MCLRHDAHLFSTLDVLVMRSTIFILALLLLCCSRPSVQVTNVPVHHAGALQNFMHYGDISAKLDLLQLQESQGIYALGARADLKGEVLILDGQPLISYSDRGKVALDFSWDHDASLIVYASVSEWANFNIPKQISTPKELETFIDSIASKLGMDTEKPFPFMILGEIERANWHVVDWPTGDSVHTHEKHITSGPHGIIQNEEVQILGFFSKHHQAIFTHHTTFMHLHLVTADNRLAAHLDEAKWGNEMTLALPKK